MKSGESEKNKITKEQNDLLESVSKIKSENISNIKEILKNTLDKLINLLEKKDVTRDEYYEMLQNIREKLRSLNEKAINNCIINNKEKCVMDDFRDPDMHEKAIGLKCVFLFSELTNAMGRFKETMDFEISDDERTTMLIKSIFAYLKKQNKMIIKATQEAISDSVSEKPDETLYGKTLGFLGKKISGFMSSAKKNVGKWVGVYESTNKKVRKLGNILDKTVDRWEKECLIGYRKKIKGEKISEEWNSKNENILQEAINQFDKVKNFDDLLGWCNRAKIEYKTLISNQDFAKNNSKINKRKDLFDNLHNDVSNCYNDIKKQLDNMIKNLDIDGELFKKNIEEVISRLCLLHRRVRGKLEEGEKGILGEYKTKASDKMKLKSFFGKKRKIEELEKKWDDKIRTSWFMALTSASRQIVANSKDTIGTLTKRYIEKVDCLKCFTQ